MIPVYTRRWHFGAKYIKHMRPVQSKSMLTLVEFAGSNLQPIDRACVILARGRT
jgi:hypothetical protein